MVEKFRTAKTQLVMMLRDSRDGNVRKADIKIRTGRKGSASRALHYTEDRLHHADIIETIDQGRQGLGEN